MDHPARVGKYQIDQFLGGGMSRVYRATDTVLGRRVALKILTEEGTADEESKARFLNEARVASNVHHENIISVYDFGEEHGCPFIVMEYLEGESLRAAIRNGHLGDFRRRMNIALQVARAVDFIHSQKVIHRDIKPENIHLDVAGRIKLMDFGIAKAAGMHLTKAGFTLGTPYYMAPEQVLGRTLGPQADVYAFGALLFEMLTAQKIVGGSSVDKIFENILYQPVDLSPLDAVKIPPALIELIARMLDKQPAQRPSSLGLVADEIERIMSPYNSYIPPLLEIPRDEAPGGFEKLPPWMRTEAAMMALGCAAITVMIVTAYLVWAWTHAA
ncbi:MAG TPA: serine/threonine-protein kinase [Bryobacteraceae bacterium]|jgi:eukaryotic-like serine/threonine-protein kinase|nr:serine/threonine-protein kinase [Bryobacteraceae bacterium]